MVNINMPLPTSCASCPLSVRNFGKLYCPPLDGRVGNEGKDSRCPLVDAGDHFAEVSKKGDMISRADAVDAISKIKRTDNWQAAVSMALMDLPSAQPELRYTKKELGIFKHGISLSLLSKRSCQHWHYDEDTATEIEFLERLYEKVKDDMRGEQDDSV